MSGGEAATTTTSSSLPQPLAANQGPLLGWGKRVLFCLHKAQSPVGKGQVSSTGLFVLIWSSEPLKCILGAWGRGEIDVPGVPRKLLNKT